MLSLHGIIRHSVVSALLYTLFIFLFILFIYPVQSHPPPRFKNTSLVNNTSVGDRAVLCTHLYKVLYDLASRYPSDFYSPPHSSTPDILASLLRKMHTKQNTKQISDLGSWLGMLFFLTWLSFFFKILLKCHLLCEAFLYHPLKTAT